MLAPVTLEFYGTCNRMARIFSSSYLMMKVGAGGHFQCSNSAEDALRNWNLSRWYFHLSLWHFPVAARQLHHSSCWTVEKITATLKALLNHSKEPCLYPEIHRTYQRAHNIGDWLGIRWGLQLVWWPVSSCWRRGGGSFSCGLIFLFSIPL